MSGRHVLTSRTIVAGSGTISVIIDGTAVSAKVVANDAEHDLVLLLLDI